MTEPNTEPARPVTLIEKIAAVQATLALEKDRSVEVKSKTGGTLYSYEYITEEAITKAIRENLCRLGVAVFVSYYSGRYEGNLASVEVVVDFSDGEDSVQVRGPGLCQDADAQKAMGKAQTYGLRTLLNKTFLQAGGDDGESVVHEAAGAAPAAPVTPPPPAAPAAPQAPAQSQGTWPPEDQQGVGVPGPASHAAQAADAQKWRPSEGQAKVPFGIGKGRLNMEWSDIRAIIWYGTGGVTDDPKLIDSKEVFDHVVQIFEKWQENPVGNQEAVRAFLETNPMPGRG